MCFLSPVLRFVALVVRSVGYLAWLGKEIISGTWDVISHLPAMGDYGTPMIVEVPMRCVTDVEITLFASSITITPGTLVVATGPGTDVAPPSLFVHSMFSDTEDDALEGLYDMERKLLKTLRGTDPGPVPVRATGGETAGGQATSAPEEADDFIEGGTES